MESKSAPEIFRDLLDSVPPLKSATIDYEIAAAIADTAKLWALLAERLMFAVESEGLSSVEPELMEDYKSACFTEPEKFASRQI
jgi:hypothetical protein